MPIWENLPVAEAIAIMSRHSHEWLNTGWGSWAVNGAFAVTGNTLAFWVSWDAGYIALAITGIGGALASIWMLHQRNQIKIRDEENVAAIARKKLYEKEMNGSLTHELESLRERLEASEEHNESLLIVLRQLQLKTDQAAQDIVVTHQVIERNRESIHDLRDQMQIGVTKASVAEAVAAKTDKKVDKIAEKIGFTPDPDSDNERPK